MVPALDRSSEEVIREGRHSFLCKNLAISFSSSSSNKKNSTLAIFKLLSLWFNHYSPKGVDKDDDDDDDDDGGGGDSDAGDGHEQNENVASSVCDAIKRPYPSFPHRPCTSHSTTVFAHGL